MYIIFFEQEKKFVKKTLVDKITIISSSFSIQIITKRFVTMFMDSIFLKNIILYMYSKPP